MLFFCRNLGGYFVRGKSMLVKDEQTAKAGFIFANLLLILIMYFRFEEPVHFFISACGLIIFSYFLKRAISQLQGNKG